MFYSNSYSHIVKHNGLCCVEVNPIPCGDDIENLIAGDIICSGGYPLHSPRQFKHCSPGRLVVVTYAPAPLMRQLGLDTERIIVPFSSKGVNHVV